MHFPLTDPIPIFLLVLLIILSAPLLNRLRIPHIIGLILAGLVLGPFGLNVLQNDASFDLFGKVGILYIMFLAGLEIDLNSFKRNSKKGVVFGLITFSIPLIFGLLSSVYLLKFDWLSAALLSTIYASHTLIAYPSVSKMGVSKNRAVSVVVAGTIVAVTAALFLLAAVTVAHSDSADWLYWAKFAGGTVLFLAIVFFVLPRFARFFLQRVNDNVAQYIFVLAVVFFASLLAEWSGLEGILGAFFAGLVLNRLVPSVSPLMNRIEFVGNAIFIPFFLISIGMMIDVRSFVQSFDGVLVALLMTAVALASKALAAFVSQRIFGMKRSEGQLLFGLTAAHAAVTLAVVMIGYQLEMLTANVLNGCVLMILVSCTVSSIVTEKAARKLATEELYDEKIHQKLGRERILIPVSHEEIVPQMMEFAMLLKPAADKEALHIVHVDSNENDGVSAHRLLQSATLLAAATDNKLTTIEKHGNNIANGILEAISENDISDVLLNGHKKTGFVDTFFGTTIAQLLRSSNKTFFICNFYSNVADVRRLAVVVPAKAELEIGFPLWFDRLKNIAANLGVKIRFFANNDTKKSLQKLTKTHSGLTVSFAELASWEDFLMVTKEVRSHDAVIIVSARKGTISYQPLFEKVPYYATKYFKNHNVAIVFPEQISATEKTGELYNPLHL